MEIVFLWTILESIVGATRTLAFYKKGSGPGQFFDFLDRVNQIDIKEEMNDTDKRRLITSGEDHEYYVDILHDNRVLNYMIHSAKILNTYRMNKQDIIGTIEEVVKYSGET